MDLATLGVRVTTDGVSKAADDLDKMAAASDKAANSSEKLSATAAKAARSFDNSALSAQRIELAKLAGQIDPTIAKLDQLDKQQSKLAQFKKSGLLSADDFTALNSAIEANRARIASATESVHSFSLNNANARRELGYLAKDLATGQWGRFQQSFATLVSSSGLLATGFGGVAAAIAAAGAPLAAFAIAAHDGSRIQNEYNAALAKTGDFVGVASGGMSKFASQVAGSNADLGKANDILIALAGNGKVSSDAFLSLGRAAMDVSKLTGDSAEKAAAAVTEMFDGTAASAVKANEQYHFLTLKVYEQIDALEKQGDAQRAAQVAADAFHDAIGPRLDEMNSQVTGLAKAWDDVKVAASGYWQEFKTGASLIAGTADMQTQIYDLMGKKEAAKSGNPFTFASWSPADETKLQDLQKQLSDKMTAAEAKAEAQRIQDAGVAGQSLLNKYTKQYESDEKKREDALISIHNAANKAIAAALAKGDLDLANQIMRQEADADSSARASFAKKPRGPKADPMESLNSLAAKAITQNSLPAGEDTAQSRLLKEQVTQLQAISAAGAKAIEKGSDLAKVQAEVGTAVNATNEYFAKQAEILNQQNVAALEKYQAALDMQNDSLKRKIAAQVDSIGMGRKEYAQQQQLNDVYAKGANEIRRLEASRKNAGVNTKLLDEQIRAVRENTNKQVKILEDGYARMDDAQSSWLNGARSGLQDFYDSADNIAGQTHDIFARAFDGLGDSIADFVTKGKGNFKDLLGSVLDDLTRMSIKFEMSRALKSLFGMGGPGGGGSFLDDLFGGGSTGFKDGGVFMNSPSLSAYSGTVVNKPTPFMFAKGAGIMGEAGPEAILPLHRGPNGKLGVTVNAPAQPTRTNNLTLHQNISVQGRVDRRTASQIANESARKQRIAQSRDR